MRCEKRKTTKSVFFVYVCVCVCSRCAALAKERIEKSTFWTTQQQLHTATRYRGEAKRETKNKKFEKEVQNRTRTMTRGTHVHVQCRYAVWYSKHLRTFKSNLAYSRRWHDFIVGIFKNSRCHFFDFVWHDKAMNVHDAITGNDNIRQVCQQPKDITLNVIRFAERRRRRNSSVWYARVECAWNGRTVDTSHFTFLWTRPASTISLNLSCSAD